MDSRTEAGDVLKSLNPRDVAKQKQGLPRATLGDGSAGFGDGIASLGRGDRNPKNVSTGGFALRSKFRSSPQSEMVSHTTPAR